jgi:HAD superfamily hydrolase (TIGR01484 family)
VRFRVLACDYDGTLAHHGVVSAETVAALKRCASSGRKLLLVTGRELDDLLVIFPELDIFDYVVAENGALLYQPSTRSEKILTAPPSQELVQLLKAKGVGPISVGRSIIATWEPFETVALEAIRELGLELQVTFNKGAVMILPSGVNKKSGLISALEALGFSAHNCVGVGDAENDHAFLSACDCAVAVANALPALKDVADFVTARDHGQGVEELIERLLDDDFASLDSKLNRHHVLLGTRDDGSEVKIPPHGYVVLVAGGSGSGKSTAVTGLLERLTDRQYQLCIVDPEGDYEGFESAVVAGSSEEPPQADQVMQILGRAQTNCVVTLLGVPLDDRPRVFVGLLTRIQELRAKLGRPHWMVVDEAHHVLGSQFEPATLALAQNLGSLLFITVDPEHVHRSLLDQVDLAIGVGGEALDKLSAFAEAVGRRPPIAEYLPEQPGQVLVWHRGEKNAARLTMAAGRSKRERHRKKYAQGELGPERSFYFRGPEEKLNLRAQNLMAFNSIADGVDDDTWLHHLRRGDYSEWMREAIKDDALALEVRKVETDRALSAAASRNRIRTLVEDRYTAPA